MSVDVKVDVKVDVMSPEDSNCPPTRWESVQAAALARLADDEVTLIDYAAELRRDRDTLKALAIELMGALHEKTKTCQRQAETIAQLQATIRAYIGAADERRVA